MLIVALMAIQLAAGPERIAPGVINTDADEYGPTLTPDSRTLFFTLRADRNGQENIVISHGNGERWTRPEPVPFSGQGLDKEPYLSPDGNRLFFASRREYPNKVSAQGEEAYDLFVVERRAGGWGVPQPVAGANSGAYDNYPAVSANGNLYFASHRPGGKGRNDLWRSRAAAGGWLAAEPLVELNTPNTDADPYVAPDESYMIFSTDRPGGAGQGDLFVSFNRAGHWTMPVSLGSVVNTSDYEYTPWVTSDGQWLYFSRGWGEIWRIETSAVPVLGPLRSGAAR